VSGPSGSEATKLLREGPDDASLYVWFGCALVRPGRCELLATEAPSATTDPFLPELEERLSNLTRAGFDADYLVWSAVAAGPLPEDHAAQPSGGASSTSYRKRRTRNPQPPQAIPATRGTTTTSLDQQPPWSPLPPPPAFGPSR
jgi:hypothetical protein